MSFTLVFNFHRQQWAAVMGELCRYIPRIHDDNDVVYDSTPENWNTECNEYAHFLDHRRMWSAVMTELGMVRVRPIRPLERVEKIDHRRMWAAVMDEMIEAIKARNEAIKARNTRPNQLIDRRGRSLPRLHFDLHYYPKNNEQ